MLSGLFDANAMVPLAENGREPAPGILLEMMDRTGIAQALAYFQGAREGDTRDNNRLLSTAVREQPRLVPCWVIDPTTIHPSPADVINDATKTGVRAMRWFPTRHEMPITDSLIDRWMSRLERAGIALIIDWETAHWSEGPIKWDPLVEAARKHPSLPLIVVGRNMVDPPYLYPAWEDVRNLYAETSYFQVSDGIADVVSRFGARRLLFGTGLPVCEPACPLSMLARADIPEEARKAIAGRTLREILKVEEAGESAAAAGFELPYKVIDVHGHLGMPREVYTATPHAAEIVKQLDHCGVEWIGLSSLEALQLEDPLDGHDLLGDAIARFPGRVRGYAAFNPEYYDPVGEVERCLDGLHMQGIKIHCDYAQKPFTDTLWRYAFNVADRRHLPVLVHGAQPLEHVQEICEEFPDMTLIMAHVGGMHGEQPYKALELAAEVPNLYLDTCFSNCRRGALEALVKAWGPHKLLFASDAGYLDLAYQLGRVLGAEIPEGAKRLILRDNALQIFAGFDQK